MNTLLPMMMPLPWAYCRRFGYAGYEFLYDTAVAVIVDCHCLQTCAQLFGMNQTLMYLTLVKAVHLTAPHLLKFCFHSYGIGLLCGKDNANERKESLLSISRVPLILYKDSKTRPISDGFRKNNVNYWAFREIRSIIPHL